MLSTLYLQNLNTKTDHVTMKHTLYLLFLTYGDVLDIVVKRGYAHITMPAIEASVALRCANGESVFGQPLAIQKSTNESKRVSMMS